MSFSGVCVCYVSHDGAPAPRLSRDDISQKGQISCNSSTEASVKSCLPSKQGNVLKESSMFSNHLQHMALEMHVSEARVMPCTCFSAVACYLSSKAAVV